MPFKHAITTVMILAVALFCLTVVCSDDNDVPTGPGNGWSTINFADYEDLIGDIVPPVYTEPLASPAEIDPMWTSTFLNKVFSEDEPMSLYSNLEYFDELVEEIGFFLVMRREQLRRLRNHRVDYGRADSDRPAGCVRNLRHRRESGDHGFSGYGRR